MSGWLLYAAMAMAGDPEAAPQQPAEPSPPTIQGLGMTMGDGGDIAATVRALQEELRAQRAEIQALRTEPATLDTGDAEHGPLVIRSSETTDSAVGIGQDVHIRGHVTGDVTAIGGSIRVYKGGRVDGNAVAVGGSVRVLDGGIITGDRLTLRREDITGTLSQNTWSGLWASVVHRLVLFLSFAGAGVLVVGLFPDRVTRVANRLTNRPVASLASGVAGVSIVVMSALVFAVTVIGLPVSFLLVALLGLAWLLGFVAIAQAVGDRLPVAKKVHGRWLAFLVGAIVLTFVGSLPILGTFTAMALSALGMGAAFSTRLGSR